ncbi:MAG TPA: PAS domain S-box protein [Ignavibacteriales bacterium]|nr:PAS domain S-box protein [Ignavibacteriales bacterium]
MIKKSRKTVSVLQITAAALLVIMYWIVFLSLHLYLAIHPFPLIILPMAAFGWFWGIKRGLIAGTFLIVSSMLFVMYLHIPGGNPVLGSVALAVSLLLGGAAGWVRKLYDAEKKHSAMLAIEHEALQKEIEERKAAEKKVIWDEHFLKVMSNSYPVGILAIDSNTDEVLYCNHSFCEMFNVTELEEKLIGGEIKNSELKEYTIKSVKDPEEYKNLFSPVLDINSRKVVRVTIEFTDNRIIYHYSSEIRDEKDEYLGRLFIFVDVTERKNQESLIKRRFEYEHLLYEISNGFINTSPEDMDTAFNSSLEKVCEFLEMDIGYFYQTDLEAGIAKNLYEWRSSRIDKNLSRTSSVDPDSWPTIKKKLAAFEKIFIPDVEKLPDNRSKEKEFLLIRGVRSVIIFPVVLGNKLVGFLGFSSVSPKKNSYDADKVLKVISDVFANALIRKQKNEALQTSEERFRLLVQHSTDMIGILDINGYVTYVSPAAKAITGKEPAEWLGKLLYTYIHPDDQGKIKGTVRRFIENPDLPPVKISLRLPSEGGRTIFLETILNGQLNNPAIKGIVCNSRDMTQHFALQEALRESRNFLNAIINRAGDPMIVKDNSHRYTLVNEAFCRLVGIPKEQLLGRTDFELPHKELAERMHEKDDYVINNGGIENFDVEFFDTQGKRHFIVTNETLYQDEKGEKYIIASIRDETRRKELEQEVNNALIKEKELSEMKSKFISMVSHEYRTPLTAILSSTELLELFGVDMTQDEKQEHIVKIKNSIDFLISMLNEVLLISRVESRRMEFNPSPFELISYCRELLKNVIDNSKCPIQVESDSIHRRVVMDKSLLRHILVNLLSNAVKYSPEGETVHLNVHCSGPVINFEIKDRGMGIPLEDQPRLFEPFFRASNVLHIAGSGLGLSIVRNCVELHKGNISFVSSLLEGTTFRVSLPDECKSEA